MNNVPQMPGGVLDLGALKGADPDKQDAEARRTFFENGFLCSCGERVARNGVQLFGLWKGVAPTPQGPQNTAMLCARIFCSMACQDAIPVLAHGIPVEISSPTGKVAGFAKVVASKPAPIDWFDLVSQEPQ